MGLPPDFLEANMPGPTPGRYAPVPERPSQANPDDPGPDLTRAPADEGGGSPPGSNGRPWATRTPIKDIKSGPFETVARGLLRALGGLVNGRVQVDDDDAAFIPDEEDDKLFAPAAGRVAARHMPLPNRADLSELEDIGAAAVALLNWAAKGAIAVWDARASRRRARAALNGADTPVYTGEGGQIQEQAQ